METVEKYYDVTPKVFLAGGTSTLTIRPRFSHAAFPAADKIKVKLLPLDGVYADGTYADTPENQLLVEWRLTEDGELAVTGKFPWEQEYNLTVELTDPGRADRVQWARVPYRKLRFNLYAVREDLYKLRPWKGDFHMHSDFSDGQESPEYVAARNRELGMDFIAVTDHHRYDPSMVAIDYWRDKPVDIKLYPGEEIHANGNLVHIINFGGSFSVNELILKDEERYYREVADYAAGLPPLAPGQDPFQVASSEWVFDRIRDGGGLSIFCHPYWQTEKYVISEAVTSAILERKKFDAFELIGGFYPEQWRSNNFQVARYMEEREKGNIFPVVGVSDAHGTDRDFERNQLAGWYYTIVLAESAGLPAIHHAIRSNLSVAVEQVGSGIPRVYGDFRLVKYISYLLERYFPRHNELCKIEGKLMIELLGGNESAGAALKALRGQTSVYMESVFGE